MFFWKKKAKAITIVPLDKILESAIRSFLAYRSPAELSDMTRLIKECDSKVDMMQQNVVKYIKDKLIDTEVEYITDSKTDAQCYIWIHDFTAYVTFRGTSSFKDILADLKISSEKYKGCIYVHEGFYDQFLSIREDIEEYLEINQCNYDSICFSGHSLGGALAQIAALYFAEHFDEKNYVSCITFGSPRVGNKCFADYFCKYVKEHYRVVNSMDIVTAIPIRRLWRHVIPNTIEFSKTASDVVKKTVEKDTVWYKRLWQAIKVFNFKEPKKDHSIVTYIETIKEYIHKTI
jgi:hypothetical protein